jgi:class 3 adenylate cyclase
VKEPEVKYAKSGDIHVAYQVFGNGPIDIVHTPGTVSHLDVYWESPAVANYLMSLASFARVIMFDKRGTGLSDRNAGIPTLEQRIDDIRAVMDAASSTNAVLYGISEGVPMSILFTATYPRRTRGLVLYGGEARGLWASDYPWASTEQDYKDSFERIEQTWGTDEYARRTVEILAPSKAQDPEFLNWAGRLLRLGASPGASIDLSRSEMLMDVRSVLPAIHVPTLVIHLTNDKAAPVEQGRYLAKNIPGAKFVELSGVDHVFWANEKTTQQVVSAIEDFIAHLGRPEVSDRILTTVMFNDIVGSTTKAFTMGDIKWRNLLENYYTLARSQVRNNRGSLVKTTGDGFLATFDGPTRAITCADAVRREALNIGLDVRSGLHTGECILSEGDVAGIAVHLAARVLEEAGPGEIIISRTVKDLVAGSQISFEDRGDHKLKGIADRWQLFMVQELPLG